MAACLSPQPMASLPGVTPVKRSCARPAQLLGPDPDVLEPRGWANFTNGKAPRTLRWASAWPGPAPACGQRCRVRL